MKNFLRRLNLASLRADTTTVALKPSPIVRSLRAKNQPFATAEPQVASYVQTRDGTSPESPESPSCRVVGDSFANPLLGMVVGTLLQHAVTQPDSLALVDGTHSFTYAQLVHTVAHLAQNFQQRGIKTGDRVGVALEANAATVCAILALHACGAAYVPLSESHPPARLATMIDDAGVRFVVTPTLAASVFDGLGIERVDMSMLCSGLAFICAVRPEISSEHELPLPSSTHTAYIIFTSGSTGQPKGVEVTHANLDALMHAWDRVMGSTRHTSLLLSALTFDASVAELFWPLHHGGTLIIASKGDANPGGAGLGNLIRKQGITHVQCTPTRATLLLADGCDRAALAHLKHLVIGGEALTRSLASQLLNAGIERITNAYGPTEATVWAYTHEVTRDLPTAVVGIGNPLFGISAAVLGADGSEITEVGVQGELVLGGPFVASGYVNRPELTSERFSPRTFQGASAPLHSYRTGDLVSRKQNGTLDFHGRTDDQVKIRGHRIELGEVEAALDSHCGVQQSIVCVRERNGSNELLALVVAAKTTMPQDPLRAQDLRVHLQSLLPAVMVPSQIVLVPELPLNASSKVDRMRVRNEVVASLYPTADASRNALSADPNLGVQTESAHQPNAALTDMILDFTSALGLNVNPNSGLRGLDGSLHGEPNTAAGETLVEKGSDFFAAGGHSMFAVALLARIEDRTGVRISIRELLSAPTPEQLAVVVQCHLETPVIAFDPLVRFRLSSANRRLYLVHGAGGNVLRYRNLARALHDVVDVVGIQAIGVEPGHVPDSTLASMVDRYVAALLATGDQQFELGGYSDGGIVAIHVAHRLLTAGRSVRSLTLLDAFVPVKTKMGLLDQLRNIGFNFRSRDTLPLLQWLRGSIFGWRQRGVWDAEGTEALLKLGFVDIYELNERLVQTEALPECVLAPALVVRTFEETPTRRRNYRIGYSPKQATVAWVHGAHDELLKPPSIPELGSAIRSFLAAV